ncbi:TonB-dependent receptor [Bacteroides pyogenes JCM 6292]|uniref:TonB-dependent receptor n=1 Tax=Bacteroides pyogenes JCM 6292 TaxID=1235809 RepID=W4PB47_9BACE|nr:TonB-dependent receptor [Bacteroides pyogenes JCM 6292]
MKKQQIVQNAKLRISYGIVGSQAIEPYSTLGLMSVAGSLFGGTSNYAAIGRKIWQPVMSHGKRPNSLISGWTSPSSTTALSSQ